VTPGFSLPRFAASPRCAARANKPIAASPPDHRERHEQLCGLAKLDATNPAGATPTTRKCRAIDGDVASNDPRGGAEPSAATNVTQYDDGCAPGAPSSSAAKNRPAAARGRAPGSSSRHHHPVDALRLTARSERERHVLIRGQPRECRRAGRVVPILGQRKASLIGARPAWLVREVARRGQPDSSCGRAPGGERKRAALTSVNTAVFAPTPRRA